ncbi:MAG TPA: hypothetical protein VL092_08730 [Chitinophagaceae bacterium]|nr:hypothetical protein [Chitinophagaceae bacterium]
MRNVFLLFFLAFFGGHAGAQLRVVELNKMYHQFNNGAELPAERNFMVNSPIGSEVSMVVMQVNNTNFRHGTYLYESVWERGVEPASVAQLISHYKLRQNASYSFRFLYYRDISAGERVQMEQLLTQTCYASLQGSISEKRSKYKLQSSPREIYRLLNYTLQEGLKYYRQRKLFQGSNEFSELVQLQIKNTVKHQIDAGLDGVSNMENLKQEIAAEIKMIINTYDYIIEEEFEVLDYETEKLSSALALNIGYGGIYRSGDVNNLKYYDAPYAGVSFSFGNRIFSSNFWNNTSLSAGVFLKNFNPSPVTEVSGPVVNLPLYAAFGYRVFNYFKINAGAAVMEERNRQTGNKRIVAQPFIGLSLEMYLWMGFNKRR